MVNKRQPFCWRRKFEYIKCVSDNALSSWFSLLMYASWNHVTKLMPKNLKNGTVITFVSIQNMTCWIEREFSSLIKKWDSFAQRSFKRIPWKQKLQSFWIHSSTKLFPWFRICTVKILLVPKIISNMYSKSCSFQRSGSATDKETTVTTTRRS